MYLVTYDILHNVLNIFGLNRKKTAFYHCSTTIAYCNQCDMEFADSEHLSDSLLQTFYVERENAINEKFQFIYTTTLPFSYYIYFGFSLFFFFHFDLSFPITFSFILNMKRTKSQSSHPTHCCLNFTIYFICFFLCILI